MLEKQLINLTLEKKLKNLTKNTQIPLTSDELIKNLSSYKLTEEEVEILKYRLKHLIEPKHLFTHRLVDYRLIHVIFVIRRVLFTWHNWI